MTARIEKLFPEYIRLDGDTQPRAEISQTVCAEYGERMKAGDQFPPVDVFFDGEDYWLADGFHRIQAYVMALPGEAVECNVYKGTKEDAQWHSYSVNRTHGLRRTNTDKRRAIRAALVHPKCQGMSDTMLADYLGVHRQTVQKLRHARAAAKGGDLSIIDKSTSRKGRDGRTINTARIGKTTGRRPTRPRSATEIASARQAGLRVCPPASMVKIELPCNNTTNCAYDLLRHFTFEYLQKVFTEIIRLHQSHQQKEEVS